MPAIYSHEVQEVLIRQKPWCSCKNNLYQEPEKGLIPVLRATAHHYANSNRLSTVTTHEQKD